MKGRKLPKLLYLNKQKIKTTASIVVAFVFCLLFSTSSLFAQQQLDDYLTINKEIIPNATTCSQFDVTLTIIGDSPAQPQEVVLVIDRSGSMGTTTSGVSRLQRAKNSANEFTQNLFDNTPTSNGTPLYNKIAIVSYGWTASIDTADFVTLDSQADVNSVQATINSLVASGATNAQGAIALTEDLITDEGTFDCPTARSVLFLTDGLPSATNTTSCNGGNDPSGPGATACTNAAVAAAPGLQTITVGGDDYEQKVFSIGLYAGLSANQQTLANNVLGAIQNSGLFTTTVAADLTGIYDDILNQLVSAASAVSGQALVTDTIDPNFEIVPGTLTQDSPIGSAGVIGQIVSWDVSDVFDETIMLKYTMQAVDATTCGIQDNAGASVISYENTLCQNLSTEFDNPTFCIPCPSVTPSIVRVGCTNSLDYDTTVDQGGCNPTGSTFSWVFTLEGTQVGTSNTVSGTFEYTGGDLEGDFVASLTYSGTYGNTTCSIPAVSETVTLTVAPVLEATVVATSDVDCFGTTTGSIDLTVTGGTEPYMFLWSNGETTEDISGLAEGSYNVSITDATGCAFAFAQAIVIDEPASRVTASATVATEISCFGLTDGSITISFAGGTSPYDISSDVGGFSVTDVPAGNQTHSGLAAGAYTYTITDANGCTETATATIAAAPSDVTASAVVATEISCFGLTDGSITISFAGGTSPYDISSDVGGFSVTDVPAGNQTHSGLAAGAYTYTITDANGCTETATATIAAAPSDVGVTIAANAPNVVCFGDTTGELTATATGGTVGGPSDYTYS